MKLLSIPISALLLVAAQAVPMPDPDLVTDLLRAPADLITDLLRAPTVKVMPLGASIVTYCWRAILWQKLQNAGITNTDFVGSTKAADCGFAYDGENEGHPGALALEFVEKNQLPGWLSAAKPDVILMHLGTNDAIQSKKKEDVIKAYSTMVDQMRASKATMKILVSLLIPLDPARFGDAAQRLIDLNKAISEWGPTKSTKDSPVVIVDNFTGFNATTDTVEGEHPNAAGNQKMADKFYGPTADAIRSVSASGLL